MIKRPGSVYISRPLKPLLRRSLIQTIAVLTCLFITVSFLSASTAVIVADKALQVSADEGADKAKAKLEESLKEFMPDITTDGKGFQNLISKTQNAPPTRDNFSAVVRRISSPGYLNHTPEGVGADGEERISNCNINDPGAGTALYHNCDVPNLSAEFLQKIVALVSPTGVTGATIESARSTYGLGLPSTIPNNEVPLKKEDRTIKYTGLELFGYNMKYSSYSGEWDRIQIMTSSRAMLNFGIMDTLRLGARSVVNGVVAGYKGGVAKAAEELASGDVIGAVGGFFTAAFEAGASESIHTVMDSSDLNVFNTKAWYRVGYGNTLYNARELSQTELKAIILAAFTQMMDTKGGAAKAKVPDEYAALAGGPPPPDKPTPSCKDAGGKTVIAPTEADCVRLEGVWNETGGDAGVTLEQWKKDNESYFKLLEKYELKCEIDTGEGNRDIKVAAFYDCIEREHGVNEERIVGELQEKEETNFIQDIITDFKRKDFLKNHPRANFNAPMNRFVCTDYEGKDKKDANGALIFYFTETGEMNSNCLPMRPPIQNGYYGNGYSAPAHMSEFGPGSTQEPPPDTRYTVTDRETLFGGMIATFATEVANSGLGLASMATRVSNTALDLSFSPIMQKLGIDKKIITLIEGFREGVFMPLSILVILLGVLTIFFKSVRSRDYVGSLKNIFLIVATFFIGVVVLVNPAAMFKLVDQGPSRVENAIVGAIYDVGNPEADQLCTASQTAVQTENDLFGNPTEFSPTAASRGLMCDVWRVFMFEPYVAGQWGTSYNNLFAADKAQKGGYSVQNTNGSLVGDAGVAMGGNVTINNWGLYQLDVLTSGTSTADDPSAPTGQIPRDIYRVVDMQAGPNNGAGTDGRFIGAWSGNDPISRLTVGTMSGVTGVVGAITIIAYALIKIQLTFVSAILLIFLPFILLIGLHPTAGRMQLKKYTGTLISLMVRRVVLVTALAIMMKVLLAGSLSSPSYLIQSFMAIGICLAFFLYRNTIQKMFTDSINNNFGGSFASQFTESPGEALKNATPRSLRNYIESRNVASKTVVSAGAAGFMTGGVSGARKAVFGTSASEDPGGRAYPGALQLAGQRTELRQLRKGGFGALQSYHKVAEIGKQDAQRKIRSSDTLRKTEEKLRTRYVNAVEENYVEDRTKTQTGSYAPISDNANTPAATVVKPNINDHKSDFSIDLENRGDIRDMRTLSKLESKIARLEAKEIKKGRDKTILDTPTRKKISDEQNRWLQAQANSSQKLENLRYERERVRDNIFRRHNDPNFRGLSTTQMMNREVGRMKNTAAAHVRARLGDPGELDRLHQERDYKQRLAGFDVYTFEDTIVAMTLETNRLSIEASGVGYSDQELKRLATKFFDNAEPKFQRNRRPMSSNERTQCLNRVIMTVLEETR